MPKIRGVKPELWTDENFVELSPYARLLWIGLWNHACDNGHLQDKSKQIKMRILPTDDVNCAELLREIEGQRLIERADGWITIPNLSHHQKPHKRWFVVCDKPGCEHPEGTSYGFDKSKKADPEPGSTVEQPLTHGGAPVDQPVLNGGSTADVDVDGDGDSDGEVTTSSDRSDQTKPPPRFDEFWDTYGKKVKRADAERKWAKAIKKADPDRIIAAAAAYVEHERAHNQGGRFIADPSTWLHGERWRDERSDLPRPLTRVQEHLSLVQRLAAEEAEQPTLPEIGHRR